jgi:diphthine-ammonia ligase
VIPSDPYSWVFHTPNLHLLPLMASAMDKPLVTTESSGSEEGDLEALRLVLSHLEVEGVITGAIASDYQWDRINGICHEVGLKTFSPLWRKDQMMLLRELIYAGVRSVLVNVSAEGLDHTWLGRELDGEALKELEKLSVRYGINFAGEGGEYETMVLDSPLHSKALRIVESEKEVTRDGGRMKVTKAVLEEHGST